MDFASFSEDLGVPNPRAMENADSPTSPAIDVWFVRSDIDLSPSTVAHFRQLLTPEDREREVRFLREEHQRQFLLTRVLVRKLLGWYGNVSPESLGFSRNAHGKPEVARPANFPWRFNLSHTRGLILCAVGQHGSLGVDVEPMDRRVNLQLADRYFSSFETESLRQLPLHHQRTRFLHYWTLKEAFIKALGTGLATPLNHFGFELMPDAPPRLHLFAANLGPAARWKFAQFSVLDRYWGALACVAAPTRDTHHDGDVGVELRFRLREADLERLPGTESAAAQ